MYGGAVGNMIASLKFNRLQKSKRNSMYEKEFRTRTATYRPHGKTKTMTTYEFAELQKRLFRERKRTERRLRIIYGLLIIIVVTLMSFFLFMMSV